MQGIFRKENTDKALKYGIYRHLPTYEKIIRNLVSFLSKKSYGKLAKKYKYGYMYNFFSGDIHLLSQIDKLIPFNTNHSKQYYDIYLNCILTLLKHYFLLINDYNTEVKVDVTKLNQINFIEIKDS